MNFAEKLQGLRMVSGWSLDELAARSNVPSEILRRLESSPTETPSFAAVVKLAKAFGVTCETLTAGVETPAKTKASELQTAPPKARRGRIMAGKPRRRPAVGL